MSQMNLCDLISENPDTPRYKENQLNDLLKYNSNSPNNKQEKISHLEKIIEILNNENNELKKNIKSKERLKGAYQLLADLNESNKEKEDLKNKLEEKNNEFNLFKKNFNDIPNNLDNNGLLLDKIYNYEKSYNSINSKNEILQQALLTQERIIQEKDNKINQISEELEIIVKLNNDFKESLYSLNDKIYRLNEENEVLQCEIKNLKKNLNSSLHNNDSYINEVNNNLIPKDIIRKNSGNFPLSLENGENYKILYEKSLKKIDALKKDNEKLNFSIINLNEEHKLDILRLNTTVDVLIKNQTFPDDKSNGISKVEAIIKNINSKVNEVTIEELKKEKNGFLETINKLKNQLEAYENINHNSLHSQLDNSRISFFENPNDNSLILKDSIQEKNTLNIDLRERDKKIEYLLQILEDKNNIIEQYRNEHPDKIDKITENNHSYTELIQQIDILQETNDNFMKEIEEKNIKIKKLNKDYNDEVAKYELLYCDHLTLQDTNKIINLYANEIELLKKQNKEYELMIEKMNKELNLKTQTIMRKETEVSSLKADRLSSINNKSHQDFGNRTYNNYPNDVNNSLVKENNNDFFNNSLNEIRDFKEKLRIDSLNKASRLRRNYVNDSIDNHTSNNSMNSSINSIDLIETKNNSIHIDQIQNNNNRRAFFEEMTIKKEPLEFENKINYKINEFTLENQNNLTCQKDHGINTAGVDYNYNTVTDSDIKNFENYQKNTKNNFTEKNEKKKQYEIIQENINLADLIQSQESWDFLRNWISDSLKKDKFSFKFNKIFKAKDDGYSFVDFINKTSDKFPTLTIVLTNHNKIIGGFTQIPWKKPKNSIDFIEDESNTSFLFSLNLMEKFKIRPSRIAICHSINSCPVFGLNDLEIVENANKNLNCFANIGTSYEYFGKIDDFYGDTKYYVRDYEIYQIIFK